MPNRLDLPPELLSLIEKRELEERRLQERRREPAGEPAREPARETEGEMAPLPTEQEERRALEDRRRAQQDRRANGS